MVGVVHDGGEGVLEVAQRSVTVALEAGQNHPKHLGLKVETLPIFLMNIL